MSAGGSYVGLFNEPGHPYVDDQVDALLAKVDRVLATAEQPFELAVDIAAAVEHVAQVIRDRGAEHYPKLRSSGAA